MLYPIISQDVYWIHEEGEEPFNMDEIRSYSSRYIKASEFQSIVKSLNKRKSDFSGLLKLRKRTYQLRVDKEE